MRDESVEIYPVSYAIGHAVKQREAIPSHSVDCHFSDITYNDFHTKVKETSVILTMG